MLNKTHSYKHTQKHKQIDLILLENQAKRTTLFKTIHLPTEHLDNPLLYSRARNFRNYPSKPKIKTKSFLTSHEYVKMSINIVEYSRRQSKVFANDDSFKLPQFIRNETKFIVAWAGNVCLSDRKYMESISIYSGEKYCSE